MNEQRVKFLLQAGPPRAGDREDPAFAGALRHAEADPALGAWVEQQQQLTAALAAKLNEIQPPPRLKQHILAGGHVSQRATRHRRRTWLALAASLTLLISLGVWRWSVAGPPPADYAALRADMCAFLAGGFSLEVRSPALGRLQAHLGDRHGVTDYAVPANLAAQPGVGCRMIDWRDRRVALICFSARGQLVHLLILPRSQLPSGTPPEQITYQSVGEWATAGWADDRNVYLVTTRGSPEMLAALL